MILIIQVLFGTEALVVLLENVDEVLLVITFLVHHDLLGIEVALVLMSINIILVLFFEDDEVFLKFGDRHEVFAVVIINLIGRSVYFGSQIFSGKLSFAETLPQNKVQVADVLIRNLIQGVLALFVLADGVLTFGDFLDVLSYFPLDIWGSFRKINNR